MPKIKLPDKGRLYHGVFPGGTGNESESASPVKLDAYESAVGREVAWVYTSHEWSKCRKFPENTVEWIHRRGAAPFIRLMLRSSDQQYVFEPCYTLKAIASGEFDIDLKAWGNAAAAKGIPLICEWGTEANGMWFPWNAVHNGGKSGAALFKDAFQRIVGVIRDGGGTDITWVFHVNYGDAPPEEWNCSFHYDPGPGFADWVGVSLYGAQGPDDAPGPGFSTIMKTLYPRLEKIARGRPIMICEFGCSLNKSGAVDAVNWSKDALDTLLSGSLPLIRGFSWWNERWQNDSESSHDTEMRVQCIDGLPALFKSRLNATKVIDRPITN